MKKSSESREKHRRSRPKSSGKEDIRDAAQSHKQEKIPKEQEDQEKVQDIKDSEMEGAEHCKPLSSFLHDKDALIQQLFETIGDSDLSEMVPKVLQGYNTDQLKKMCLKELEGMSDGLILHILRGDDVKSYPEVKSNEKKKIEEVEEFISTATLKRKLEKQGKLEADTKRNVHGPFQKIISPDLARNTPEDDILELYPSAKEIEKVAEECKKEDLSSDSKSDGRDLELLELEMRARAIRSLLRARGASSSEKEDLDEVKI